MSHVLSRCPICDEAIEFDFKHDYNECREVWSEHCKYKSFSGCVTRERAVAEVLFKIYNKSDFSNICVYECAPCMRGLSLWLKEHCDNYFRTGFYPDMPIGVNINGLRNENLESLTLEDESVDIWLHLDVMEHLFNPFKALREIYRTLRPNGVCIFTAPTYPGLVTSEQVSWVLNDGTIKTKGNPEYHGNPQDSEQGSLVTWKYGYDLPLLISRETGFDVEVRRWQSERIAVLGVMTEVYICTKS